MRKFFNGIIVGVVLTMLFMMVPSFAIGVRETIDIYRNNVVVKVNDKTVAVDNFLYKDTTYVPFRAVAEMLNKDVVYEHNTKTINIKDKTENNSDDSITTLSKFNINGVEVGTSLKALTTALGKPDRVDPSVFGFSWYIYNSDYSQYVQVGILDERVVAVFSNIGNWKLADLVQIGSDKSVVNQCFGEALTSVVENHSTYSLKGNENVYNISDDLYGYIFYDEHNNNTVTAVMLWDKALPFRDVYMGNYENIDNALWESAMQKQMFDLSNTLRLRMGYDVFTWDEKASTSAYLHSLDMANNNYFSHTNLDGESPFDRMKEQGISYYKAAENIAMGQRNSIFALHGLMNSIGHRKNILGDYKCLGVGVSLNSQDKRAYYTQNFYTPRS